MSIAWHCDVSGCNSWTTSPDRSGFVRTEEFAPDGASGIFHFCGWDCVLKFAATIDPPFIVTPGDDL